MDLDRYVTDQVSMLLSYQVEPGDPVHDYFRALLKEANPDTAMDLYDILFEHNPGLSYPSFERAVMGTQKMMILHSKKQTERATTATRTDDKFEEKEKPPVASPSPVGADLKKAIVQRYSLVPEAPPRSSSIYVPMVAQAVKPKVRYHNDAVVTTKGEKYVDLLALRKACKPS